MSFTFRLCVNKIIEFRLSNNQINYRHHSTNSCTFWTWLFEWFASKCAKFVFYFSLFSFLSSLWPRHLKNRRITRPRARRRLLCLKIERKAANLMAARADGGVVIVAKDQTRSDRRRVSHAVPNRRSRITCRRWRYQPFCHEPATANSWRLNDSTNC